MENSSKLKPVLLFDTSGCCWGVGMSDVPSREISGKAEAALSKSKSLFPPDPVADVNSLPRMSFSRSRKLLIVVVDVQTNLRGLCRIGRSHTCSAFSTAMNGIDPEVHYTFSCSIFCIESLHKTVYTKAAKAELTKDFDLAFKLYIKAAEDFLHQSRKTTEERAKSQLKSRAGVALQRAEKIKSIRRDLTPVVRNPFSERK